MKKSLDSLMEGLIRSRIHIAMDDTKSDNEKDKAVKDVVLLYPQYTERRKNVSSDITKMTVPVISGSVAFGMYLGFAIFSECGGINVYGKTVNSWISQFPFKKW